MIKHSMPFLLIALLVLGSSLRAQTRPAEDPNAPITIHLKALSDEGRPVSGAEIALWEDYRSFPYAPPDLAIESQSVTTDPDGTITIGWPRHTPIIIEATAEDYAPHFPPRHPADA